MDSSDRAKRGQRRPPRRWRLVVELLLLTAAALLIVRFLVTGVGIVGESMQPTLASGDRALVVRLGSWLPGARPFGLGDVVVFLDPLEAAGGRRLVIKRIVAVAGETVALSDGTLVVDGQPRPEPYVRNALIARQTTEPLTVPAGHVFVLGDNRAPLASQDSRRFGPLALDRVVGRAELVYWPLLRRGDNGWRLEVQRLGR